MTNRLSALTAGVTLFCVLATDLGSSRGPSGPPAIAAQGATNPLDLVKEGRKLVTEGKVAEALELYRRALTLDPALFEAHLATGIALDLQGDYVEARKHLTTAIERAPDENRNTALSAMAVSYAFEAKSDEAARFYQQRFDKEMAGGNFEDAAATANAMGRVYLESGDLDNASKWYETGNKTAARLEKLPADQVDLWAMRWHHAAARIAARRGKHEDAKREAALVKSLVDKNAENAKQMPIYQYLVGYTAFYAKDYKAALAELLKADLEDPFVLGLLAQAYEKTGDDVKAREYYGKVLASTSHNINNAFSRPLAQKKIGRKVAMPSQD